MAISTQIQNLNLIPGKSAPVVVHLSQGNVGNTVQFYLYDGDDPYYPTNVSIAVHGVRADNTVFGPYTVSVTSGSNLVSFNIVSAMTSVNGAAIGELVLTDNNQNQVGSANFGMLVEATPYSSSVTYEDDLSIYQRILAYVQSFPADLQSQISAEIDARKSAVNAEAAARTAADNAEAAARTAADNNLQTQINQIVSPTGEAPSAAEVQNARIGADGVTYATLGDAIRTQNKNLSSRIIPILSAHASKSNFTPIDIGTVDTSYYVTVADGRIYINANADGYGVYKIPVSPNTLYKIYTYGYYSNKWAITDASNNLLDCDENTYNENKIAPVVGVVVTKPTAAWLYLPYRNISMLPIPETQYKTDMVGHIVLKESETDSTLTFNGYCNASSETGGYYYPGSSNEYTCEIVPVKKGERFYIRGTNIYTMPSYIVYDNNFAPTSTANDLAYKGSAETYEGIAYANTDGVMVLSSRNANGRVTYTRINTNDAIKDKKWDVIGDSFSASDTLGSKPNYVSFVTASLGLNTINYGVGGTGYNNVHENNAFYNVANRIRSDSDVVTVFGSFNDLASEDNPILGDETDTGTSTIAGCMANTFINIRTQAPDAMILCIAPSPWQTNNNVNGKAGWAAINPWDYVSTLEKVCKKYNVCYLNLYEHSDSAPWISNFVSKYQADATHPNSLGHFKFIYPLVKHKILEMFN